MSLLGNLGAQLGGNLLGGSLLGKLAGNQQGALMSALTGLISNGGGLSGLTGLFAQHGMEQHVQSWVGKGENMPISGDHVTKIFGADKIQEISQQVGLNQGDTSSAIAHLLPSLVDKLTPNGTSVGGGEMQQGLAGLLSKGLGGLFH